MCSDTPAPDPMIGQAAMNNVQIAKDALDYYKQKDAAAQPRQDQMDALTTQLANQQIATSKFNDDAARQMLDRYHAVGVPAENAMYADARDYASTDRQAAAAGAAATDVDTSMDMANDARRRSQARAGVNPADGRALSMDQDAATAGALGKATAMNNARTKVSDMGIMLRKDAANFAKGMSSNAAQTFGTAALAGSGATGALGAAGQMANQTTQTNGAGFGTAINGNNSAGSILNQEYGAKVSAANASGSSMASGLGAAAGAAAMAFSDKHMKEDVKPVDDATALKGVEKTDVKSWQYKGDSPAADGGQRHVGAMAQDMQKNLGDAVAPGGKVVDVISALGVNMAATRALSKKVDKLQSVIAQGVRV